MKLLFLPVLGGCSNWFPSPCLNCVFVPGSGRLGLPGVLPKNPVCLILHPGSSDLLCLLCLLPGAGYPLCADRCCGCIYRYAPWTNISRYFFINRVSLTRIYRSVLIISPNKSVWIAPFFLLDLFIPPLSFQTFLLIKISIYPSFQTGTQPAMGCPPHMSVTRQAPSSPSPCSSSHPPTSLSWASEL